MHEESNIYGRARGIPLSSHGGGRGLQKDAYPQRLQLPQPVREISLAGAKLRHPVRPHLLHSSGEDEALPGERSGQGMGYAHYK